jgi:hypothetical protein
MLADLSGSDPIPVKLLWNIAEGFGVKIANDSRSNRQKSWRRQAGNFASETLAK